VTIFGSAQAVSPPRYAPLVALLKPNVRSVVKAILTMAKSRRFLEPPMMLLLSQVGKGTFRQSLASRVRPAEVLCRIPSERKQGAKGSSRSHWTRWVKNQRDHRNYAEINRQRSGAKNRLHPGERTHASRRPRKSGTAPITSRNGAKNGSY
jgi:hypothetical protein